MKARGFSGFKPMVRVCRDCGVPLAIARGHIWEEQGRILSRDRAQRLVIVENKIVDGIVKRVGEKVDGDAREIFMSTKAYDAWRYVSAMLSGWRKAALGFPLVRRPFYEIMCDQARILGMADATLAQYKHGREAVISCTHCYSRTFFAGDLLGALYAGEGKEAALEVSERDGEILFSLTVLDEDRREGADRCSFNWEVPLPGYIDYRRCARCGIPFAVSFFSWDFPRGLMLDTRNGEAVTLIDVAGLNAAYAEIRARRGSWVDGFLATEIKQMVDGILPGLEWKRRRPEERVRDLFFLAYRGMGNPVSTEPSGEGIRARIENPFNYPIVAGIAASFLSRGKEVAFSWERSMPGRMELDLRFL